MTTTTATEALTPLEKQLLQHVARLALLDAYEESYENGFYENFCHDEPDDFDWSKLEWSFSRVGDGDTELEVRLRYNPDPSLDLSFAFFDACLDDLRSAYEECYEALEPSADDRADSAFVPEFDYDFDQPHRNSFVVSVSFTDR